MFAKSRKEKFVEQAQELAHDLSEAIAPHVERARDELAPRLADARDQIAPRLSDARDTVAPRLAEARDQIAPKLSEVRDQIAPRLADARDELAPRLAEAREQLAPHAEEARDRLVKGVAAATAAATPVAVEARRRGVLAAAALKGEPVKRKSGKKKYVVFAGLLGLGALAFQKLRGGDESANWQTSYSPSPAPTAVPDPQAPVTPAPSAGSHTADVPVDSTADPVGATPGESLSDATEEPHPVTTPDAPAEEIDVTAIKDPDKA
jgi:F0F1-type ATP synthase membrane subunit b/b'